MVSGAKLFTEASRQNILSTVNFLDCIYSWNRSYKINKSNMLAKRINSTESYTKVMDLKMLPDTRNGLNMHQNNYQALLLPD